MLPFCPLQLVMHDGRALVSCSADEDRLRLMAAAAVDRLFDRCCDAVRHTDVSMRRRLRGRCSCPVCLFVVEEEEVFEILFLSFF
ncbi:hypothetical protein V8C42DRAFT_338919 [Trichoderma barbatum]